MIHNTSNMRIQVLSCSSSTRINFCYWSLYWKLSLDTYKLRLSPLTNFDDSWYMTILFHENYVIYVQYAIDQEPRQTSASNIHVFSETSVIRALTLAIMLLACLLGLLFDSEDGGSTVLWNLSRLLLICLYDPFTLQMGTVRPYR
jgi:hypothetical protein